MSLLTLPANPSKGATQVYKLNTEELYSLIPDNYFKDENNLRSIEVVYTSALSNQIQTITFIPNGSLELDGTARFSPEARSSFQLRSILLVDKQNGRYKLKANDIPDAASYNIFFLEEVSGSWFNMLNTGDINKFGAKYDSSEFYVGSRNTTLLESEPFYGGIFSATTGIINKEISNLINHRRLTCFCANEDLTSLYATGIFEDAYFDTPLPPQGQRNARVVKIDVETKEVEYLFDVQVQDASDQFAWHMLVDEEKDRLIMSTGSSKVIGYSISQKEKIWEKSFVPNIESFNPHYNSIIRDYGNEFVMMVQGYDSTNFTGNSPIRISKITGENTNLLDVFQHNSSTFSQAWDISPDGKIVMFYYDQITDTRRIGIAYDGTTWTGQEIIGYNFNLPTRITADIDALYFNTGFPSLEKYGYNGERDSSFSTPSIFFQGFGGGFIADGKLIVFRQQSGSVQLNKSTGEISNSFRGLADTDIGWGYSVIGENVLFKSIYSQVDFNSSYEVPVYEKPIASNYRKDEIITVVNTEDASLERIYSTSELLTNSYYLFTSGTDINTSPLYPSYFFLADLNTLQINAFDRDTMTLDTAWPQNVDGPGVIDSKLDGDFMYCIKSSSRPGDEVNFNDSLGQFTSTANLFRINMTTKAFDRSFQIVLPQDLRGGRISFTDNYIYITQTGAGSALTLRVHKSTQVVQEITPEMIGASGSTSQNRYLEFIQTGENKILVYCVGNIFFQGGNIFDRPYVILEEDSLLPNFPQPDTRSETWDIVAFNPQKMELAGRVYTSDQGIRFVTYKLDTNQRILGLALDDNNNSSGRYIFVAPAILLVKDGVYYMSTKGTYTYNYKPYSGIIKMETMGIISE
jgi:hypothetical protein